jgi:lipopolysaccharide/colanic/teichoic acid biosynthesis glycosyltransferase
MKRAFDCCAALVGLVLTSPLFLVMAVWIKLDSPGPVFYRGLRIARGGGRFRIFKFRSMSQDADRSGPSSTAGSDTRVTRSGHFIRRFKLDELAQLLNVLIGDMSLVGPRPEVLRYLPMYAGPYAAVLRVRPGITDWASIWNRDEAAVLAGYPDADRAYEQLIQPTKLGLQLKYVQERSFLVDLSILRDTLRALWDHDFYPEALRDIPRLHPTVSPASSQPTPFA